jgi:hypothetical protein
LKETIPVYTQNNTEPINTTFRVTDVKATRSKICINNETLKQINTFNCLGYNISYEGEKDFNIKAANFVKVLGIINQIFKPSLVSRHTRIGIYKTLATVLWKRSMDSKKN